MTYELNKVDNVALYESLGFPQELVEEIEGFNDQVVNHALSALSDPELMQNAWDAFEVGFIKYPETMMASIGGNFSHYPLVREYVLMTGSGPFYEWLKEEKDPEEITKIVEEVVIRNVFHFFERLVRTDYSLSEAELDEMRREFSEMNFSEKTKWLSMFYNGLQTSAIEYFVDEAYIKIPKLMNE